ncbi:hypothetical protein [Butyrivibrio sp. FCS014]|uniref:hypothetical protein n=1 Tax=Butyrivibrio sp. FCS014 TaxID=1408304 RepID=UPI000467BAF2|nr:hypothetical protein [Butyrivibrio sp. FCS014]
MDIVMNIIDGAINFSKETVDAALGAWEKLDDNKKKLFIGCLAASAAIIAVAVIAYKLGKAHGQNEFLDDEDF